MNRKEKLIKLLATTLAVLLAFGIIAGVVGMILFFVRSGNNNSKHSNNTNSHTFIERNNDDDDDIDEEDYDDEDYNDDYTDEGETFDSIKDLNTISFSESYSGIENLKIESPFYAVSIRQGNVSEITVECENVLEDYTAKVKNNTLTLSGSNSYHSWGEDGWSVLKGIFEGKSADTNRQITITLPKDTALNLCSVESGTGNIEIENISAQKLKLENGTGSLSGKQITADSADIECGTGSVELNEIYFKKTDLESGTGSTTITGQLEGKTEIESGMGSIELKLQGSKDNYNFDIEKGLGSLTLDNKSYNELTTNNSNVSNWININGGMGSIAIEFQRNS